MSPLPSNTVLSGDCLRLMPTLPTASVVSGAAPAALAQVFRLPQSTPNP